MGTFGFVKLGVLIIFLQTFAPVSLEESTCPSGFGSELLVFKVERMRLHRGRVLGKVGFKEECSNRTRFLFDTDDTRFKVEPDGVLKLKREVKLHTHKVFCIHAWDSRGKKRTVPVRVENMHTREQQNHTQQNHKCHRHQNREHHGHQNKEHHGHQNREHHGHQNKEPHGHHGHQNREHRGHQNKEHHGHQNREHHGHQNREHHGHKNHPGHQNHHGHQKNHSHGQRQGHQELVDTHIKAPESPAVPVLLFPKASPGLKRRKRAWVIPPINFPENDRGPFPKSMVQIRSDADKEVKIYYSIKGPGADTPPEGLFTVDRNSGMLFVTQPLDREKQDKYQLQAYAVAEGKGEAEDPMDIIIFVIDQNDNKPIFTQDPFLGTVPEASEKGFEIMKVTATDLDEPDSANSDVRYTILSQDPELPSANLFIMNPVSGGIRVSDSAKLDRERFPKYTLEIEAADMEGQGLTGRGRVVITVSDSNDNAPQFEKTAYTATVPENKKDAMVVKMPVTDGDEPHSKAWAAVFKIVDGDPQGLFNITTGPSKQEGILTTAKGLDFEKNAHYTLLVSVVNEDPFATRAMITATATVTVTVEDVNEAPVFNPPVNLVVRAEDVAVGSDLVLYTATDPDTARKQTLTYKVQDDRAGWLKVNGETGQITVKSLMDRESSFMIDGKYTALITATDNDAIPATGTGTLQIQLTDVNDNAPVIVERRISVCNKEPETQFLTVTDADGPGFTSPYTVELLGMSKTNWTARMNDTKTGIILNLNTNNRLEQGVYTIQLRLGDNLALKQDSTLTAEVCDCTGVRTKETKCALLRAAGVGIPGILGILGAILLLLLLGLILLLAMRRKGGETKEPLLQDDDVRDNIYYYDEEGGGEDDLQDYDLSILHRGLDNRPDVFRTDAIPIYMPESRPQYRPRPANPEDIGCFIDDNLKAADNDPTAPPYDSLLVFDYEGGGSEAGSLSSLNSSSSGNDQDYDCLQEWGPRFKKLADMYGGGEDDML